MMMISDKLSLKHYIECTTEKASITIIALVRVIPNVGPRYTSRLFIARVVSSIMLYAVLLRGTALHILSNTHKLSAVYRRRVLKICSVFSTISEDTSFVILGMGPIGTLADEWRAYMSRWLR